MADFNVTVGRFRLLRDVISELNKLVADVQNRISTFSGHTHGGVSTGSGSTGAGPAGITLSSQPVFYSDAVSPVLILNELVAQMTNLSADLAAFDTRFNAHTHGGVSTGASSTGAGPTLTATVVALPSAFEIRVGRKATLRRLVETFNAARADLAALNTALNAHTHGGVSTGSGSTGAGPSAPARTADSSYKLVA
jgi:hypothetical protein